MPTLSQQKKQLETENAELKRRLDEAERRAEDNEARAENAAAEAEKLKAETQSVVRPQSEVHMQAKQEPELLYDPFDSKNPHKIVKNPPGYKLGWKNPHYRENHRSWRGWVPVTFDSDVGRNLKSYLLDPPRKMAHVTDNLVRRGDSILCTLPEKIWEARQQKRVNRANRQSRPHAEDYQADTATVEDIKRGPQQVHAPNSVGGRTMTS